MKATLMVAIALVLGPLAVSMNAEAQAEPIDGYTLIGEDPVGDFPYKLAEQGDPSGLFGTGKIDIIRLDAGFDGDTINLRMTLPGDTGYGGLGNHMWVVQFDVDGTSYDACWTIITAGTSAQSTDVQENTRGCSMFAETDVGPRTKAAGVNVVQEEGQWYIEWPFAAEEIGGVGVTMENIVATTWARTGDTDDSPPEFQFELHDVAPDEGAWSYVVGAAGEAAEGILSLEADRANVTAGPGSWLVFEVLAFDDGNVTGNASFEASGPDGWQADVVTQNAAAGNATGNQTGNATTASPGVEVHIGVPDTAENGTYNVTIQASAGENASATLNLTITVDASLEPMDERQPVPFGNPMVTGNETSDNGTAQAADGGGLGIPGPGALVAAAVLAVGGLWLRRRRGTGA
jgi:hypothetical protein